MKDPNAGTQDEPEWHNAESDAHETDGEGELYEFGQECLDRIALALGGTAVMPIASALLPVWAADSDWKKRHAALICLAQIAEGCVKVMMQNLDSLVTLSLKVGCRVWCFRLQNPESVGQRGCHWAGTCVEGASSHSVEEVAPGACWRA